MAVEWTVAPTAGGVISLYIGFSHDSTAGDGNPGFLTGADGAYTDGAFGQLVHLGSRAVTNDADQQVFEFSSFIPRERYGCLVLHNDTDQALDASDATNMAIRLIPIQDSHTT